MNQADCGRRSIARVSREYNIDGTDKSWTAPFRRLLTKWFTLEKILYLSWFFFWFLNGLDKFFNGENKDYGERWGVKPYGWFGVNRDDKFIHYVDRLDLPEEMALTWIRMAASAPPNSVPSCAI